MLATWRGNLHPFTGQVKGSLQEAIAPGPVDAQQSGGSRRGLLKDPGTWLILIFGYMLEM